MCFQNNSVAVDARRLLRDLDKKKKKLNGCRETKVGILKIWFIIIIIILNANVIFNEFKTLKMKCRKRTRGLLITQQQQSDEQRDLRSRWGQYLKQRGQTGILWEKGGNWSLTGDVKWRNAEMRAAEFSRFGQKASSFSHWFFSKDQLQTVSNGLDAVRGNDTVALMINSSFPSKGVM